MWDGIASDGSWIARVHHLADHQDASPQGKIAVDIPTHQAAASVLTCAQAFSDYILRGDSRDTDKVINDHNFESPLRPARYLLAQGDADGTRTDRYITAEWVWLEGQIGGYAFAIPRPAFDALVAQGDALHLIQWRGHPALVVIRQGTALAAIPVRKTFWFNDGRETVADGVPSRVRRRLPEIAGLERP